MNGITVENLAVHGRIEASTSCSYNHAIVRCTQIRQEQFAPRNCGRACNSRKIK